MTTSLKVSFIWTRTFFELFDDSKSPQSPFSYFTKPSEYKAKIRSLYSCNADLTLPWRLNVHPEKTNSFWKCYLDDMNPLSAAPDVIATRCFPLHVPVRKSLTKMVTVNLPQTISLQNRVSFEGFFYRHGVSVVCTFSLHDCPSLADAVDQAMSFRHTPLFSIPSNKNPVTLNPVGEYCLNLLTQDIAVVTEWHDEEIFSLVTIIQGESDQMLQQGDNIHRVLEALASWNRNWKQMSLPDLNEHVLPIKIREPGDVMYGHSNSRVLWIPRLFNTYALEWYSRNLLIASMQVKSHRDFIVRADNNNLIKPGTRLWDYAKRSEAIIRNMEKGLKTYRTLSVSSQIKADPQLQSALSRIS